MNDSNGLRDQDENEIEDMVEMPPRHRRPRPLVIISVIVLIAVIIGGGFAALRTWGNPLAVTPTPTPAGSDLVAITTNPLQGTITIDGRPIPTLSGDEQTPLKLAPGTHKLVWTDPPFAPLTCFLAVPVSLLTSSGTNACPIENGLPASLNADPAQQIATLSLTASLTTMLSSTQRAALLAQAQTFISSFQTSSQVQPGEHFVNVHTQHLLALADQPFQATMHFQLDTDPNSTQQCIASAMTSEPGPCRVDGIMCQLLCPIPGGNADGLAPQSWQVYAVLHVSWDYTTLSGQSVAQNQPDLAANPGYEYLIPLYIQWEQGRWQVTNRPARGAEATPATNNPACLAMQALMDSFLLTDNFSTQTVNGQNELLSWQYLAGTNSATGCLAKGTLLSNYTPVPTLPAPQLLYRFGVLLAVNAAAHSFWPDLPVANSYEQQIAQNITR